MAEFYPSNQSDAFADEAAAAIKKIALKYEITFDQAAKAYEVGVRAQQVDMLHMIEQHLCDLVGCFDSSNSTGVAFALDSIAQSIERCYNDNGVLSIDDFEDCK